MFQPRLSRLVCHVLSAVAFQDFKYHEHEGLVGWILLCVRLSLFAWFRSGCQAAWSAFDSFQVDLQPFRQVSSNRQSQSWTICVVL